MDPDVVCHALDIEEVVEANSGFLSVGADRDITFLQFRLLLFQPADGSLVNEIVLDKQDKRLEENNEIGFFSSDREGSFGAMDIFEFNLSCIRSICGFRVSFQNIRF